MAKHVYPRGIASVVTRVWIPDSASATGGGKVGLSSASTGLVIAVIADNEAAPTIYTVAAGNVETITAIGTYQAPTASKCRFREVDATNLPGLYEIHLADARWAVASSRALQGMVFGASGAAPVPFEAQLGVLDFNAAALGSSLALQSSVDDLEGRVPGVLQTKAEADAALAAADDAVLAAIAALNNLSSAGAQAAAAAALVTYGPTVPADLAGLSTLTAAQVWAAITGAAANIIADHVLRRDGAAAFASAHGDAPDDATSLLGVIMRGVHADTTTHPGFLTVFDPAGGELAQIPLASDPAADPAVGLG